jgi:hypothetical protein
MGGQTSSQMNRKRPRRLSPSAWSWPRIPSGPFTDMGSDSV